jgi:large subunit ribosomal protein L15
MKLHQLLVPKGAHKRRKIKGRGASSGHGKTSGRGSKGQKSRKGRDFWLGFEGGQTPLIRRFPKRGFRNPRKKEFQIVNLKSLDRFPENFLITPQILEEEGLIRDGNLPVKILGEGKLNKPLKISAHRFSKKAKEEIIRVGGEIQNLK